MQGDGNLVLYRGSYPVWYSRTDGYHGAVFRMQDDCNAVIYHNGSPRWASGTDRPPVPTSGRVTLSQGSPAPHGYWYVISVSGFNPGQALDLRCHDTIPPEGFRAKRFYADGNGRLNVSNHCYSGVNADHWVVVNGVHSNRVRWGSSGGSTGSTPTTTTTVSTTVPPPATCAPNNLFDAPNWPTDPRPRSKASYSFYLLGPTDLTVIQAYRLLLANSSADDAFALYDHYLGGSGLDYWISFSDFKAEDSDFSGWLDDELRSNVFRLMQYARTLDDSVSCVLEFDTGWVDRQSWAYDWAHSLSKYRVRLVGHLTVGSLDSGGPRRVSLDYRAWVSDVFDFDHSFIGASPEAAAHRLSTNGWAAEFWVRGVRSRYGVDLTTQSALDGLRFE
jgi:hypothetical protein